MAGRTVLIKSVLSSTPAHYMQTMMLPNNVLERMERLNRKFLWGATDQQQKLHLVAWDQVQRPKNEGGLGIRNSKQQNMAFLFKLCWELITKHETLWVQILKSKYKCGNLEIPSVKAKQQSSWTWRSINRVWEEFYKGVGKKIGNGLTTNAWRDRWSPLQQPLLHYIKNTHIPIMEDDKVANWTTNQGAWNIELLRRWFDDDTIKLILAVPPPHPTRGEDRITWRPSTDGSFSVRSAYHFIEKDNNQANVSIWKRIWKIQTPEKIKTFLWQLAHDRILTNSVLASRRLTENSLCPYGCGCEETPIHTVRDCKFASDCWKQVIEASYFRKFMQLPRIDWLNWNTTHQLGQSPFKKWKWTTVFGHIIWTIWLNRCKLVKESVLTSSEQTVATAIFKTRELTNLRDNRWRIQMDEGTVDSTWFPLHDSEVRLDVDGSRNSDGISACGGLVRDKDGNWLMGFTRYLGFNPITMAEILAIRTGLQVCWECGYRKVIVCSDSTEALRLTTS